MPVATDVDHLTLAHQLAARPEAWPLAPRFDPVRRWYHRLVTESGVEAWLLTWLPGQATDLHDHGGSAGAFVMVSGALTEETVSSTGGLDATAYSTGAGRRFGSHHVHRLSNTSGRPAISLHVYGPALTTMTRYRYTDGGLAVLAVDRAGQDW